MKNEIKVLYVVSLATFMRSFGQVIYSPSIVIMREDLVTTTTMIGLTFSVYGMILAFSQIAYGPIVDRFDTKKILILGLGFFSVASLIGYLANGIWLLLIVRGFQAIGIAAAASVGIALIADLFPDGKRGQAMSIFETFNAAGAAAGPLAGAAMAVWFSWRVDFLLLAVVSGLIMVTSIWVIPALPSNSQSVGLQDMLKIFRTPETFGAIVLGFVHFYGLYTMHTILPIFLTEQYGYTEGNIGWLLAMLPVGVIIGSLSGGKLSDRIGSRLPVLIGTGGTIITFSFLAMMSNPGGINLAIYWVFIMVLTSGLFMGFCLPVLIKIMVESFPVIRGTAGALQYFARFGGATVAPVLTGYLNDSIGLSAGFGSAALFIFLGWLIGLITIKI